MLKRILFLSTLALLNVGCATNPGPATQQKSAPPQVIAHRGASGYLPEHTLESAILAYGQGADYIEQDLVLSKDGVPVVLHDIHLETVTDVESKFPQRQREDGRYYAVDFTLAELKALRVHERQSRQGEQVFPARFDGQSAFTIATFEEQIAVITQLNRQTDKQVGIYPEIKSPAWHIAQGQDITAIVLAILRKHGLDDAEKPVIVQCFDFTQIKRMREDLGAKVKLVQLLAENSWGESDNDYDYLKSPAGIAEISQYANGIGPWIPQLVDLKTGQARPLIELARQNNLIVHPYTFRKDQLPEGMNSEQALDLLFIKLKVNGVFTDFTDTVVNYLR